MWYQEGEEDCSKLRAEGGGAKGGVRRTQGWNGPSRNSARRKAKAGGRKVRGTPCCRGAQNVRSEELPEPLQARLEAAEGSLGRPVVVRAAVWDEPALRGRLTRRAGALVLEYRDDGVGCFWRYDIIAELLDHVEQGHLELELRDEELA